MMADTRYKNAVWRVQRDELRSQSVIDNWGAVHTALLMDIRDELQTLNRIIGCPNFIDIPHRLSTIVTNTTKRRYRRKPKA